MYYVLVAYDMLRNGNRHGPTVSLPSDFRCHVANSSFCISTRRNMYRSVIYLVLNFMNSTFHIRTMQLFLDGFKVWLSLAGWNKANYSNICPTILILQHWHTTWFYSPHISTDGRCFPREFRNIQGGVHWSHRGNSKSLVHDDRQHLSRTPSLHMNYAQNIPNLLYIELVITKIHCIETFGNCITTFVHVTISLMSLCYNRHMPWHCKITNTQTNNNISTALLHWQLHWQMFYPFFLGISQYIALSFVFLVVSAWRYPAQCQHISISKDPHVRILLIIMFLFYAHHTLYIHSPRNLYSGVPYMREIKDETPIWLVTNKWWLTQSLCPYIFKAILKEHKIDNMSIYICAHYYIHLMCVHAWGTLDHVLLQCVRLYVGIAVALVNLRYIAFRSSTTWL